MKKYVIYISFLFSIYIANSQWTNIGPFDGPVKDICVNGDQILVFSINDVLRSKNKGNNWEILKYPQILLNDNFAVTAYGSNRIYSHLGYLFVVIDSGLVRSTDDGDTWITINNGFENIQNNYVRKMVFIGDNIAVSTRTGFYLSTNNGNDWKKQSDTVFNRQGFVSINNTLIHSRTSTKTMFSKKDTIVKDTLIDGEIHKDTTYQLIQVIDTTNGIAISNDTGRTWQSPKNGLKYTVYTLSTNNTNLYAGTENGIYLSSNKGEDWIQINYLERQISQIYINGNSIFAISPYHINYSSDNGTTWSIRDINKSHPRVVNMVIDNNTIYATTSNGLYTSTNDGVSWEILHNPIPTYIYDLKIFENKLYGASYRGIILSSDDGNNWEIIDKSQLDSSGSNPKYLLTLKDSSMLCAMADHLLYKSTDKGKNWAKLKVPWTVQLRPPGDLKIYDNTIFFVVDIGLQSNRQQLYISSDNGGTWSLQKDSLLLPKQTDTSSLIILLENIDGKIYVGTNNNGLIYTTDYGTSWEKVQDPILQSVTVYAMVQNDDNLRISSSSGFFISKDRGLNWEYSYSEYEHNTFSKFLPYDNYIFAIIDSSFQNSPKYNIMVSLDNGLTWNYPSGEQLDITKGYVISKLIVKDDYLYAATGQGIFKTILENIVSIKEPDPFIRNEDNILLLSSPYPNPASNYVIFKIGLNDNFDIRNCIIDIFNINGEKVNTNSEIKIINDSPNNSLFIWNCPPSIPEGSYFIKISNNKQSIFQKIIIRK